MPSAQGRPARWGLPYLSQQPVSRPREDAMTSYHDVLHHTAVVRLLVSAGLARAAN